MVRGRSATATISLPFSIKRPPSTRQAASSVPKPVAPGGAWAATTGSARLATASAGDPIPSHTRALAAS